MNTASKEKPSEIVQELCKKLKSQLDALAMEFCESPKEEQEPLKHLFKEIQEKLTELSR